MANKRKRLTGEVLDAKMQKTAKVKVSRSYRHPVYGKVLRQSKNYLVHDELGVKPGDLVQIVESRPISKRKRWVVEQILKSSTQAEQEAEA